MSDPETNTGRNIHLLSQLKGKPKHIFNTKFYLSGTLSLDILANWQISESSSHDIRAYHSHSSQINNTR